jgi:hypothetical protein
LSRRAQRCARCFSIPVSEILKFQNGAVEYTPALSNMDIPKISDYGGERVPCQALNGFSLGRRTLRRA